CCVGEGGAEVWRSWEEERYQNTAIERRITRMSPRFVWHHIRSCIDVDSVPGPRVLRAKVPGGWLIVVADHGGTFMPDPAHQWDGSALPVVIKKAAQNLAMAKAGETS